MAQFQKRSVANLSVLALSLCSGMAFAQSEGGRLEEVIVTATKDARELSKVPVSISAYTQESMDIRAIRDVNDLVLQTPGIDLTPMAAGGSRLAILGIDSSAGAATTATYLGVALFAANALDATPVLDFTPAYSAAPLQTARTIQPRTWGATATMKF